jgi:hypothetical protein
MRGVALFLQWLVTSGEVVHVLAIPLHCPAVSLHGDVTSERDFQAGNRHPPQGSVIGYNIN